MKAYKQPSDGWPTAHLEAPTNHRRGFVLQLTFRPRVTNSGPSFWQWEAVCFREDVLAVFARWLRCMVFHTAWDTVIFITRGMIYHCFYFHLIYLSICYYFSAFQAKIKQKNVRITITGCSPSHADYTTRRIVHVKYSKERYIVLLVTLWFRSLGEFGIEKRLLSLSSLAVCLEYQQGRATRMKSGKFHSHFQKGIGRKM